MEKTGFNLDEYKKIKELLEQNLYNTPSFIKNNISYFYRLLKDNCSDVIHYKAVIGPREYVPLEESILLVHSFLGEISSKYSDFFIKDYNNGIFDFSALSSFCKYDSLNDKYTIGVKSTETLDDAVILLHEYVHLLSRKSRNFCKSDITYKFYAELAPILSEFMFRDYLIKEGYKPMEVAMTLNQRLLCFKNNVITFNHFSKIFMLLDNDISIDNDFKDKIMTFCESNKNVTNGFSIIHTCQTMVASSLYKNGATKDKLYGLIENLTTTSLDEYNQLIGFSPLDIDKDKNFFVESLNESLNTIEIPKQYVRTK